MFIYVLRLGLYYINGSSDLYLVIHTAVMDLVNAILLWNNLDESLFVFLFKIDKLSIYFVVY